jgi:hypothetical protein
MKNEQVTRDKAKPALRVVRQKTVFLTLIELPRPAKAETSKCELRIKAKALSLNRHFSRFAFLPHYD